MTKNTRFFPKSVNGQSVWFWKVRANMTHNGRQFFHCSKDWLYTGTLRVWVRQHERIPEAVMESPQLNVSVSKSWNVEWRLQQHNLRQAPLPLLRRRSSTASGKNDATAG